VATATPPARAAASLGVGDRSYPERPQRRLFRDRMKVGVVGYEGRAAALDMAPKAQDIAALVDRAGSGGTDP